jgi:acyl carrier protein
VADIGAEFRDILVFHLAADETTLTENARFNMDLAADGLDISEIVVACEEKFDIDIPNPALIDLVTVGDFIRYIETKVAAADPRSSHPAAEHVPPWPGQPQAG